MNDEELTENTSTNSIPIWHSPVWITAIVGLVSVFFTIPEIIGNYLTKEQDIELAKEKTMELRILNLESKQNQELKLVNETLSKEGNERIFFLRYLATTTDDEDTKKWAKIESIRLQIEKECTELEKTKNEFNKQKQELKKTTMPYGLDDSQYDYVYQHFTQKIEAIKNELSDKKIEFAQLKNE